MSAIIDIERIGAASKGLRYRVWHNDEVLLDTCREPLCEAARALSRMGITGRILMRRKGKSGFDMTGLIAVMAAQTVNESERHGPRFGKYVAREIA